MANQLKMAQVHSILTLHERGWSYRRIARALGVHRETVRRYVLLEQAGKLVGSQPGVGAGQNRPNPPTGSGDQNPGSGDQNRPNVPAGSSGPVSRCEPYRSIILDGLDRGLSAQRIWQDLVGEYGFEAGYDSVKRYVRKLNASQPLPFRRMECEPGQEAQVDFGTGAPVIDGHGRRRRTHVIRVVLSHSRKGYSESVYRQTTEQFIRCLENAFMHFGGVPRTVVIDNLKAAVSKADWFDPELNPKIQSFCAHYGTVILPTRPRTPRHKGKVERGVDYVQANALKGRVFTSLAEQNRHLQDWERQVADTRIHGTTRRQVSKAFEAERPALGPLPASRFPSFREGRRKVNRDGHIEVDKAYYSVPPEYLGRRVWVRWDSRLVRVFNHRFEQITVHARHEPGRFSTQGRHIDPRKCSPIERGASHLLSRAGRIGPASARWAEQVIAQRGVQGVRVVMGLLSLAERHPCDRVEQACEIALTHGAYRLGTLRRLIQRQGDRQEQFRFIDEHPIIRSLSDYGDLVHTSFTTEPWHE